MDTTPTIGPMSKDELIERSRLLKIRQKQFQRNAKRWTVMAIVTPLIVGGVLVFLAPGFLSAVMSSQGLGAGLVAILFGGVTGMPFLHAADGEDSNARFCKERIAELRATLVDSYKNGRALDYVAVSDIKPAAERVRMVLGTANQINRMSSCENRADVVGGIHRRNDLLLRRMSNDCLTL